MSTGLNCLVIEIEPAQWYYVLESWNSPKGAYDWREYADCYGPFPTDDRAYAHLGANHANPGGSMKQPYNPEKPFDPTKDTVLASLIKQANERPKGQYTKFNW